MNWLRLMAVVLIACIGWAAFVEWTGMGDLAAFFGGCAIGAVVTLWFFRKGWI